MNKNIILSINIIIAIIIFSSCTLTKRHYNNGYYVEFKKSNKTEKSCNKEKIVLENNAELINDSIDNDVALESTAKKIDKIEIINSNKNIENVKEIRKKKFVDTAKSINYKKLNGTVLASTSKVLYVDMKNEITDSNTGDDDDNGGLSMFWIVILILLLLWAFGFVLLANALIHLLLILALVLLIIPLLLLC